MAKIEKVKQQSSKTENASISKENIKNVGIKSKQKNILKQMAKRPTKIKYKMK